MAPAGEWLCPAFQRQKRRRNAEADVSHRDTAEVSIANVGYDETICNLCACCARHCLCSTGTGCTTVVPQIDGLVQADGWCNQVRLGSVCVGRRVDAGEVVAIRIGRVAGCRRRVDQVACQRGR